MECLHCHAPIGLDFAYCEECGRPTGRGGPVAAGKMCGLVESPPAHLSGGGVALGPVLVSAPLRCAAFATHQGRRHPDNQDAAAIQRYESGIVLAVADGVSTSSRARAAADLAVKETIGSIVAGGGRAPDEQLRSAVAAAHQAICRLPHEDARLAEPQATVAVAMVRDDRVWYAWVGDTRLYLLDPARPRLLSSDDSWLQDSVARGIPYAEAINDPNAHCITQSLGMRDEDPDIHVASAPLSTESWLLLCSDGLWNYLPEPRDLWSRLQEGDDASLADRCMTFVDFANAAGGSDNITVAIYRHRPAGA